MRDILRAQSKGNFRVRQFILSFASCMFKGVFTLPRPAEQSQNEPYPWLKFNVSTVSALLLTTDKHNIDASTRPVLRDTSKTLYPHKPAYPVIVQVLWDACS